MYAIIDTGGKQYRVVDGDVLRIEKINAEVGNTVYFDNVLMIGEGSDVKVGTPYIDGQKVAAEVVAHGRADKVVIFKYLPKKDSRKKQGHRQPYTEVKIQLNQKAAKSKATPKAEEKTEDNVVKSDAKPTLSMKKDEIIAFAKERNIDIDEKATKAVLIETIEAALK